MPSDEHMVVFSLADKIELLAFVIICAGERARADARYEGGQRRDLPEPSRRADRYAHAARSGEWATWLARRCIDTE